MRRNLGVLMPVASLPARHGIGDFGYSSKKFIDWLKIQKYHYWQVLPLNPLGPGESPYMSTSSFALDYRYISLDLLTEEGLLNKTPDFKKGARQLIFWQIGEFKKPYLYKAYRNFISKYPGRLERFKEKNAWVSKYATFQVFKEQNDQKPWLEWKKWQIDYYLNHRHSPRKYSDQINFIVFMQMMALKQWKDVLSYAHKKGIQIIADMPFYVGLDSMEVWLNRDQFLLDENNVPYLVAGVPPDAFSDLGQLWGSPIYNFDKMRQNGYKLLVERTTYLSNLCDILRIDHFRAFDTYYVIPQGREDAIIGEWKIGPRKEFFECLYKAKPSINLIAEDLGELFDSVLELRDDLKLPGMFIVQFTIFDKKAKSNNNMIVYSGTHDNETLFGWFKNLKLTEIELLKQNLNYQYGSLYDLLVRYVFTIPSKMTILPLQDLLKLDNRGRLNTPGTVGAPNWMWRMPKWETLSKVRYPKKSFFRKRNWTKVEFK